MRILYTFVVYASLFITWINANNKMTYYGCPDECETQRHPSCGKEITTNYFCALSTKMGKGYCDQYVVAMETRSGAKKMVRAKVVDSCSSCEKYHVDFSKPAFTSLASAGTGVSSIIWAIYSESGSLVGGPYYSSVSSVASSYGLSSDGFISAFKNSAAKMASNHSSTSSFSTSGSSNVDKNTVKKTTTKKTTIKTTTTRSKITTTKVQVVPTTVKTPVVNKPNTSIANPNNNTNTNSTPVVNPNANPTVVPNVNNNNTTTPTTDNNTNGNVPNINTTNPNIPVANPIENGNKKPENNMNAETENKEENEEEGGSGGAIIGTAVTGSVIGAAVVGLLVLKKKSPSRYEDMKKSFPEAFGQVKRSFTRSATQFRSGLKRSVTSAKSHLNRNNKSRTTHESLPISTEANWNNGLNSAEGTTMGEDNLPRITLYDAPVTQTAAVDRHDY